MMTELRIPSKRPADLVFPEKRKLIEEGRCPTCKGRIMAEDFRDDLSRKEYGISGMCQKCQDSVFGIKEE
jgi:hypothetical protein